MQMKIFLEACSYALSSLIFYLRPSGCSLSLLIYISLSIKNKKLKCVATSKLFLLVFFSLG